MKRPSRARISKLPPRRVFVFGAGVSASSGIAVAKDILRESVVRLAQRSSAKAGRVHKLLHYLYPNFDEDLRNYPNIEDFLNLLEMAKAFNTEEFIASKLWSRKRLEEVERIALKAVTEYIWERMQDKGKLGSLRDFISRQLRLGDVIITFNWDLTVERAIFHLPQKFAPSYNYRREAADEQVALLKPHGSIDWFVKRQVRDPNLRANLVSLDHAVGYYPYFSLAENPDLLKYQPLIVPPVATKEFRFGILNRAWRSVYRAVSDATRLEIIGYSLPREDQFARLVFRRAIRNNLLRSQKGKKRPLRVVVINPDESVQGTFARLVGGSGTRFGFYQAYFEDYVSGMLEE